MLVYVGAPLGLIGVGGRSPRSFHFSSFYNGLRASLLKDGRESHCKLENPQ